MEEMIQVPKKILIEMYDMEEKMEQMVETLEVLLDKETLKRLKKGEDELKKGEYIEAGSEEVEEILG
jgi:hypothetical protein